MTYDEFVMWQVYLDKQMNEPSRTDYYLAQLTAVSIQPHLPKGKKVTLEDFLHPVKFVRGSQKKLEQTKQSAATQAKSFLAKSFGIALGKAKKHGVYD